jgi:pyocin large subunit-like protein
MKLKNTICISHVRFCLILVSCLWVLSCSPKQDAASLSQDNWQNSTALVQTHDFAPGQLQAHYEKHKQEFGLISVDQYLDQAQGLLNAPAGKDVLEKTRDNGDILHYRVSTGEFAVMTSFGRIRTYFKTDMNYWMKQ